MGGEGGFFICYGYWSTYKVLRKLNGSNLIDPFCKKIEMLLQVLWVAVFYAKVCYCCDLRSGNRVC